MYSYFIIIINLQYFQYLYNIILYIKQVRALRKILAKFLEKKNRRIYALSLITKLFLCLVTETLLSSECRTVDTNS